MPAPSPVPVFARTFFSRLRRAEERFLVRSVGANVDRPRESEKRDEKEEESFRSRIPLSSEGPALVAFW